MNREEVKFDHFKDIQELIQHLEMWYAEDDYFAYDRYFHLRDARIMGMFIYELQQENQQLKEKINTYEDPEDLTLMFMYCDEKAKDKIKQLKEVIEEVREYAKRFDIERLHETCEHNLAEVLEDLLQILDKVKEN